MQSVWYGNLFRKISEKETDTAARIVGGGADDYAGYKFLVGYVAGLQEALELAKEVDREQLGIGHGTSPDSTTNHR